jgi:hypothetical protein
MMQAWAGWQASQACFWQGPVLTSAIPEGLASGQSNEVASNPTAATAWAYPHPYCTVLAQPPCGHSSQPATPHIDSGVTTAPSSPAVPRPASKEPAAKARRGPRASISKRKPIAASISIKTEHKDNGTAKCGPDTMCNFLLDDHDGSQANEVAGSIQRVPSDSSCASRTSTASAVSQAVDDSSAAQKRTPHGFVSEWFSNNSLVCGEEQAAALEFGQELDAWKDSVEQAEAESDPFARTSSVFK